MRRHSALRFFVVGLLGCLATACASGSQEPPAVCGDGLVTGSETCDDLNTEAGDGCDKTCQQETGFTCDDAEPSDCSPICGDGLILGGETCDGTDLGGKTCENLVMGGGVLRCDGECQLDPSGCLAYACGNGTLDDGEACDGADVGTATCQTEGYDGGSLACTGQCALDTSGCTLASCGNGIVEGIEACDDAGTAPEDGCGANCAVEAGWECTGQPSVCSRLCGNGRLDTGETCDGADLGGQTCLTQGYAGGTLACTVACAFNTSACELPTCGNGQIDSPEQCDGANLNGASCTSLGGYIGGTLACTASCGYHVGGCIPIACGDGIISAGEACDDGDTTGGDGCNVLCNVEAGWVCTGEPSLCTRLCGNAQVDSGEQCDGATLNGATCVTRGFDRGNLGCKADCTYDTTGCSMNSCGDGIVSAGEQCDGVDLAGATCVSLGFVSGALGCTANCGYLTTGCVAPACGDGVVSAGEQCDDDDTDSGDGCNAACQVESGWVCSGTPSVCVPSCGNGALNPGEDCDGALLGGATCQSRGFAGGTLGCTASCSFDTSGCQAAICPNGIIESGEQCDGGNLNGQTCVSFGYAGGTLACTASCSWSTAGCVNAICGNGVKETGEQCDDSNTNSNDGCSSTCQWEQTCTADETIACGGVSHRETVSGNNVSGYTCTSYGSSSEHVYAFTPSASGSVTVSLTCDDNGWDSDDWDLGILTGACNPKLCTRYASSSGCDSTTINVVAGTTYYLVVEQYSASDGYTLRVQCN
jgi:cysteine-rich repeat protein